MKFECQGCLGVYEEVAPDGTTYRHVCPPLSAPELIALGMAPELASQGQVFRDGHRDETPIYEFENDGRGNIVPKEKKIKKEGKGRKPKP